MAGQMLRHICDVTLNEYMHKYQMKSYEYITREAESSLVLADWTFDSYTGCESWVLPDGCRDIIVQESSDRNANWFISELSVSAYKVPTAAGIRMRGIRLKPGIEILQSQLNVWLDCRHPSELFVLDQIDEFCVENKNLADSLDCLSSGKRTVLCVAKDLGVSLRTLERLVRSSTGQTPYYWFSLARIRLAGRSLVNGNSLSDVAIENGFSDQAHMNREMKKWFKLTPNQIRANAEMHSLLHEKGYG